MIPIERYIEAVEKIILVSDRGCPITLGHSLFLEVTDCFLSLAEWRLLKGVQLLGGERMQSGDFME